eukprot:3238762-Amphidinium_carterae.1
MEWIGMKNTFKVTHKSFDHDALELLLRELVVKLQMPQKESSDTAAKKKVAFILCQCKGMCPRRVVPTL